MTAEGQQICGDVELAGDEPRTAVDGGATAATDRPESVNATDRPGVTTAPSGPADGAPSVSEAGDDCPVSNGSDGDGDNDDVSTARHGEKDVAARAVVAASVDGADSGSTTGADDATERLAAVTPDDATERPAAVSEAADVTPDDGDDHDEDDLDDADNADADNADADRAGPAGGETFEGLFEKDGGPNELYSDGLADHANRDASEALGAEENVARDEGSVTATAADVIANSGAGGSTDKPTKKKKSFRKKCGTFIRRAFCCFG